MHAGVGGTLQRRRVSRMLWRPSAMKLNNTTLPMPEDIARHMGLRDLRIGRHYLRGEATELTGSVSVCSFWHAEVVPSFHPRIALAVATAKGEPFHDFCTPDWVKAV